MYSSLSIVDRYSIYYILVMLFRSRSRLWRVGWNIRSERELILLKERKRSYRELKLLRPERSDS